MQLDRISIQALNLIEHILQHIAFNPAVFVSFLALIFTVASFWWLNVRRGKLVFTNPQYWGSQLDDNNTICFFIPLVIFNSGAKPYIIQTFRIRSMRDEIPTLIWAGTRSTLTPEISEKLEFKRAFALKGREAKDLILQFQNDSVNIKNPPGKSDFQLEVLLAGESKWRRLSAFTINPPSQFIKQIQVIDLIGGIKHA